MLFVFLYEDLIDLLLLNNICIIKLINILSGNILCLMSKYICDSANDYLSQIYNEKDTDDRVPDNKTLFELVKQLSTRIDKLENENKLLKNSRSNNKNIMEILNNQEIQPLINFENWIINDIYPVINNYYQDTFLTNIADAICNLLNHYFDTHINNECLPIQTTSVKIQQFYIYETISQYENDCKWKKLTNEYLNNYLEHICNQFIYVFNEMWYKPNEHLITNTEKYKDTYFEYYKKMLGGNISQDVRNKQIRKCLFDNLKKYSHFS